MSNLKQRTINNQQPARSSSADLRQTDNLLSNINYMIFYRRAQWNHIIEVRRWLEYYPELLSKQDSTGNTALHWAAEYNVTPNTVQFLLNKGADPNVQNYWGATPLHLAMQRKQLDTVKSLICAQADFNLPDYTGKTPFHIAVDCGFETAVQYLLNYDVNIDTQDRHGNTPLHDAMMATTWLDHHTTAAIIKLLLKGGASQTLRNALQYTPDENAAFINKQFAIPTSPIANPSATIYQTIHNPLDLCLRTHTHIMRDNVGCTPLHRHAQWGNTQAILKWLQHYPELINDKDHLGNTPLHLSTQHNPLPDTARTLIMEGKANVNAQNDQGCTPLHLAVHRGHLDLIITLIATTGIDCNRTNQQGRTPFHDAVQFNQHTIIKLLTSTIPSITELKINYNTQDNWGNTPLHDAMAFTEWDTQYAPLIPLLLKKGADPSVKNDDGQTPAEYAQQLIQDYRVRPR